MSKAASPKSKKTVEGPVRFAWRKLSGAKWADSWLERLAFLGPQRVMVIEFPGAKTVRVEAHGITRREADDLLEMFGGQAREMNYNVLPPEPERPPLVVRGKLAVLSTPEQRDAHEAASAIPAIVIPAGMAFGTGDHATTAMCLRRVADFAAKRPSGTWEMLDLGTGSGILALAAKRLGAKKALGGDFDPHAVRTAKENVLANGGKGVTIRKMDVRTWEPDRTWDLVVANLFSELLREVAPKLARCVAPGGALIFSGILKTQEAEVLESLRESGLKPEQIARKGKWISGIAFR